MLSKMTTWLKNRIFVTETKLQLDTKSSESGLAALMGQDLGEEQSAAITATIAGIERGVPERELRVIHGDETYSKAEEQFRHQKRITGIITEIGHECDRQARREGGNQRLDTRQSVLEQARAAAAYTAVGPLTGTRDKALPKEVLWPWPADEFRPHDARRNLIVAGAHVISAIERLDRVSQRETITSLFAEQQAEAGGEHADSGGPPPLLFIRNRGMQPDRLLFAIAWLVHHQQAPLLHIVANNPENLFDVFKKMSAAYPDDQVSKMFLDVAHGVHVAGNAGEIQPIIASQHLDPIEPQAPLLLLYPSLETLEWVADQHGRTGAPWCVLPWDWEELAEWLEDQEAEELTLE